jgi:hypothetical protein
MAVSLRKSLHRFSVVEQSTAALAFLFLVFIGLVYAKYVQQGGLIYDDWAVWHLGLQPGNLVGAYKYWFPLFAFRPLAPVYYALTSRFEGFAIGYILVNLVLWCGSVVLTATVLRELIGSRFAVLFAFLAVIPTLSSTMIFSPAMQSIHSLVVFLWALSFMLLHQAIIRSTPKLALWSIAVCALMCATYEVALPLLALSLVLPLLREDRSIIEAMNDRIFLINTSGILGVVVIMIVYQKIGSHFVIARASGTSRLVVTDPVEFLAFAVRNLKRFVFIMVWDMPALLMNGVLRLLANRSLGIIATWLGGVLVLLMATFSIRYLRVSRSHLLILLAAIVAGMFGVILIHTAARVEPTIHGYYNRGLTSFSFLLPMLVAAATSLAYSINRWCGRVAITMAIGFFAAYLASFIVQRDNYIAAVRVQTEILADLAGKFDLPLRSDHINRDVSPSEFIIANVPEFLLTNFNDETIFSDEVDDWNHALVLYTNGRLRGGTVSQKKFCGVPKRVVLKDNSITFADGITMPIADAWYYEYSQLERSSMLLRIRDGAHLREVFRSRIDCSGSYSPVNNGAP